MQQELELYFCTLLFYVLSSSHGVLQTYFYEQSNKTDLGQTPLTSETASYLFISLFTNRKEQSRNHLMAEWQ